jgi:Ser/Thr protein kinase RdoA (MazF antagonist)
VDTLLGDAPRLGRFWESPALTPHGRALLSEARLALAATLPDMPGAAVGLIHADPLRENLLQTGAGLALIDFDDCAAGMRGHDLGSALIQTAEAPGASERAAALAEGYGISSGPLPAFTLLRALASCGWAVSRLPADDPRIAAYAGRAERLAKAWLG